MTREDVRMYISVPLHVHEDERGRLVTLFNRGEWKEANYIETEANVVRGNHYHTRLRELVFMLEGEVEVRIERLETAETRVLVMKRGDMLIIEPHEVHAFHTRTRGRWLNFLSEPFDPDDPDIVRREARAQSSE